MRSVRAVVSAVVCAAALVAAPAGAGVGGVTSGPPPLSDLALAEVPTMTRVAALDDVTRTVRGALGNANRYFLNTWWNERVTSLTPYQRSADRLQHRGTINSEDVRRYASVALSIAAPLATRTYDYRATGVPASTATDRAVLLVQMLVRTHTGVLGRSGWGESWQSPLWASQAALAGWLVGPALPVPDQVLLARMLEVEADYVTSKPVKYLRNRAGAIVSHGDSGSEEMAWEALALFTAVELMPSHPRRTFWADHAYRRFAAAYARPADVTSNVVLNARPLSRWLGGSNVEPSGVVVNHGRISPDYTASMSLHAAVVSGLVGEGVPAVAVHGHRATYGALTSHQFGRGWAAPGGTVYRPNSSAIYYPMGADWGTDRQVVYGVFDLQMSALGLDRGFRVPARKWAALHLGHTRRMQARFTTGQTYGPMSEDGYFGREEWTGALLAYAELTDWLASKKRLSVDNRSPGVKVPRR
ncbi:MAG TPA: hypothetical protein VGX28_10905 [Frankiaceae bacterium]|jgi:hypothetical protein|nr:hypothetical protein [Frankiaceae bacterium]